MTRQAFAWDMPKESVWAFCEDHADGAKMGASNTASITVTLASSNPSLVAPWDGWVAITMPAGTQCRFRIDLNAVAVAGDPMLIGGKENLRPIRQGHRVALFGEGATFTASITMIKRGYPA